jgi:hypothetical protein
MRYELLEVEIKADIKDIYFVLSVVNRRNYGVDLVIVVKR